ncbi:MAG: hypothetical protein Q9191_004513 [Dirinaria sp. TL-2023a]
MAFASRYPQYVESVILLAPGGIGRRMPDGYGSPFFHYPSLCSSARLKRLVAKAHGLKSISAKLSPVLKKQSVGLRKEADDKMDTESCFKANLDIPAVVQWQFDNHQGLFYTFLSNYQYGPIMNQQNDWKRVRKLIRGEAGATHTSSTSFKLQGGRVLAIFGTDDSIVNGKEVSEDMLQLMTATESIETRWISGGHDFPVRRSDEVVDHIASFWDLASSDL